MSSEMLKAAGRSHVGRVRDHNEDTAAITEIDAGVHPYVLWLVADGMGGGAKGEVASATARDETIAALQRETAWDDPALSLRKAFIQANEAVHTQGTANGELSRSAMGTTLVAALLEPESGRYWVANVGDSRAYIAKGGKLKQLTKDHSLVAEQVAAGQLTEEEARLAGHRNVITRAIGTDPEVEPDVFGPRKLEPGERLLLCSDGLHGMVNDQDIAAILAARPGDEAADALIAAANAAGGKDNVTAVVGGWAGEDGAAVLPASSGRGGRLWKLPLAAAAAGVLLVAGGVALLVWPSSAKTYTVQDERTCAEVAGKLVPPATEDQLRAANKSKLSGSTECLKGMSLDLPSGHGPPPPSPKAAGSAIGASTVTTPGPAAAEATTPSTPPTISPTAPGESTAPAQGVGGGGATGVGQPPTGPGRLPGGLPIASPRPELTPPAARTQRAGED